jgi:hypothetical protein
VKALDGLLEVVAPNEAHDVEEPAVRIVPQAVDGHNSRMFQPAGDCRLQLEACPAGWIMGVPILDLLEGNLATQFIIRRYRDLSDNAFAYPRWQRQTRERFGDRA